MRIIYNIMGQYNPFSGGTQVMLTQLRYLREAGYDVGIYFYSPSEQPSLVNFVKDEFNIIPFEELTQKDVVVVSEEFLWVAHDLLLSNGIPYIMLNQGISGTFFSYNPYYLHKATYESAIKILSNSSHTTKGIQKIFDIPADKIYEFRIGIDSDIYYPQVKEKNIACYLTYKNMVFSKFIHVYFQGRYPDWELIPIEGKSRMETADIFRKSKLFLTFGGPEGFGLPSLEAALCGCKVLGFDGCGGKEYFKDSVFTTVNFMDHLDFVDKLPIAIKNIDTWSEKDLEYIEYLRNLYSIEKSKKSIIDFFNDVKQTLENRG